MVCLLKKPIKIFSMEKDNKAKHKIVQTYAEDMAKAIEGDKEVGLIKKIIHGEEEHEIEKRNLSPESKKNKFFMIVSALLILLALAILSFFIFSKDVATVPVEKQFVPIIFVDRTDFLEVKGLSKEEVVQAVQNKVSGTTVKPGGVEGIYLRDGKKVIGLREFMTLVKSNFVLDNNDFVNDNFLLGVVNNTDRPASAEAPAGRDFFMLLKVRTLPDIFDSLRVWENKMFFDLHGFFGIDISSETSDLLTKGFQDSIVENKNARILYEKGEQEDKKIAMMYIFADDTSVIITNTPNAAHEIMLRLASSQVKK